MLHNNVDNWFIEESYNQTGWKALVEVSGGQVGKDPFFRSNDNRIACLSMFSCPII